VSTSLRLSSLLLNITILLLIYLFAQSKLGNMAIPEIMKAVILKESYTVAVEDVPTPKIKEDGDVLVKVHLAGLCGMSNLRHLT
jgi:hypothetical protein